MIRKHTFIVLKFILVLLSLQLHKTTTATHIVGSEVYYENLGNGQFEFFFYYFKDQIASEVPLPGMIGVSIYEGRELVETLDVPLVYVDLFEPDDIDCIDNLPVKEFQRGYYSFIQNLDVNSTEGYTVATHSCCRVGQILNLEVPFEQGATVEIYLSPLALQIENNSLRFYDYPPMVICGGFPFVYDHSAIDPDGTDDITYAFEAPLRTTSPMSLAAYPGPPPYNKVRYNEGYDAKNPIISNPQLKIHPTNGFITGTPLFTGIYTVGVTAYEWRDGELLSAVHRDFQFQVDPCTPEIVIDFDSVELVGYDQYLLKRCEANYEVFVKNKSIINALSEDYEWEIYDRDYQLITIDSTRDLSFDFQDTGTYYIRHFINRPMVCGDSALITVLLYDHLYLDIAFEMDSCLADSVAFYDYSYSDNGDIVLWEWDFGDDSDLVWGDSIGSIPSSKNIKHWYSYPDSFLVHLMIEDLRTCQQDTQLLLPYFPVPKLLIPAPDETIGCEPLVVNFESLVVPIDETYDILWNFGDGTFADSLQPQKIYTQGLFTVSLELLSPIGCYATDTFHNIIEVKASPIADYEWSLDYLTNYNQALTVEDFSIYANEVDYYFGDGKGSNERDPIHEYVDTGWFELKQIAIHENGCSDTLMNWIHIYDLATIYFPNVFTPNFDGHNEFFQPAGLLNFITNYELTIWNRWGELVFTSTEPHLGWDGLFKGNQAQGGYYVYQVQYNLPIKSNIVEKGGFLLMR